MDVDHDACRKVHLDVKKIESIARRLSKAAHEAELLGITVFGGSGTGSLRIHDDPRNNALILAQLNGVFDGGDGGYHEDDEGFLRGES